MHTAAWFIRHAESTANAGLPTTSPTATELSALGSRQAERFTLPAAPSLIVVSPYVRTRLTAEPTIDKFPDVPVETWPVHEFTFLDPAKYVGTTQDERQAHVNIYRERNDPDYRDGGAAESFYDLLNRAAETLERAKQGHNVAIFSHARFIRAVQWVHDGKLGTPNDFFGWVRTRHVLNCSTTTLSQSLVPKGWSWSPSSEDFSAG